MTTIPNRAASLSADIDRIASRYPSRTPRASLDAVQRLRDALGLEAAPAIGVVGTNGKTSTATYLARLLGASGVRAGLYVSPHLSEWTERIRIDNSPCDPGEMLAVLGEVDELARSGYDDGSLRFFDVLTLAAARVFERAGASVAVYEAGIGGRLDATRVLEPSLVILTSVAIDHAEVLGEELGDILREKLLVAPVGATVLSFPLGPELERLAGQLAADNGFRIAWVDPEAAGRLEVPPGLPSYLCAALALAVEGARFAADLVGSRAPALHAGPPAIDLGLPGRLERGERDGVPYVLDAAHNEAAWHELFAELARRPVGGSGVPVTALLSISPGKRREGLSAALRSFSALDGVILTRHTPLAAEDPRAVAAELRLGGLEPEVVEDVGAAADLAFERARQAGGGVLVFGSTHLAGDVRRHLGAG